jgi:hypothetical protein
MLALAVLPASRLPAIRVWRPRPGGPVLGIVIWKACRARDARQRFPVRGARQLTMVS